MTRLLSTLLFGLTLAFVVPACGGDDDGGDNGGDGTPDVDASDGVDPAAAFCADWDGTCGYGSQPDYYASEAACIAAFNGYDATRQGCVQDHWEFADAAADGSADEIDHCTHASGTGPCE